MKLKTCKVCKNKFSPIKPLQFICTENDFKCATEYAQNKRDSNISNKIKADKKAVKTRLNELKSKSEYMKEAQQAFNAYIRARDEGLGCISCGTQTGKKNAGHYRSTQACPELRLNELNVHLQCEKCNTWLSANLIPYRQNLIKKIGIDLVEWVEGNHPPKKYTIEDLKNIRKVYKEKLKLLG